MLHCAATPAKICKPLKEGTEENQFATRTKTRYNL